MRLVAQRLAVRCAVDDLVQVLSGGPLEVDRQPERRQDGGESKFSVLLFILAILAFWLLRFFLGGGGPGGFGPGRRSSGMYFPMGGGFGGGGSGSGGFSGGGGSFGGGGSSGSW